MRIAIVAVLCAALMGCAASKQEVASRLGSEFIGQNLDALVVKFGPPASTYKMNSGEQSTVWQLTAITDVVADRGYGQASTRFCKVTAISSPNGMVNTLNTEDSNAGAGILGAVGAFGSICAQRLGMQRQS